MPWMRALLVLLLAAHLGGCWAATPEPARQSRYSVTLASSFPDPKAQALAVAAERGDADEVRRWMRDEGVNPDVIFADEDGFPLLAWPIYARSPEGLRAMLENGADPNVARPYPHEEGRTQTNHSNAMVWAAEQHDPVYLQLLLAHGGDPDTRSANNEALLYHAFIKQNQWQNVQVLVEGGADVNIDAGGMGTILSTYAGRGGFEMAHWLLQRGADPMLDYIMGEPVRRTDSHAIEAIYWHPGNPDDPSWQHKCQQWLLSHGHQRPPMPEHYRRMRQTFGFPTDEADIPLPEPAADVQGDAR
ncbi:ankyrin repeat domain-containing protein [Luteimonas aestuarii]|uniref:Ankyrin repeat domain-containing protein n=1 Tax=Luteimonas aestuarii TaxID=453837 RepID=A0A4R5TTY0_9GAMM|nr:ankyrin repeat domain-containing protein [Luteimonas aestuarii]TDK24486.1 ankyrin repeat domain-containing protein [Luteimonas aestuarii]